MDTHADRDHNRTRIHYVNRGHASSALFESRIQLREHSWLHLRPHLLGPDKTPFRILPVPGEEDEVQEDEEQEEEGPAQSLKHSHRTCETLPDD